MYLLESVSNASWKKIENENLIYNSLQAEQKKSCSHTWNIKLTKKGLSFSCTTSSSWGILLVTLGFLKKIRNIENRSVWIKKIKYKNTTRSRFSGKVWYARCNKKKIATEEWMSAPRNILAPFTKCDKIKTHSFRHDFQMTLWDSFWELRVTCAYQSETSPLFLFLTNLLPKLVEFRSISVFQFSLGNRYAWWYVYRKAGNL